MGILNKFLNIVPCYCRYCWGAQYAIARISEEARFRGLFVTELRCRNANIGPVWDALVAEDHIFVNGFGHGNTGIFTGDSEMMIFDTTHCDILAGRVVYLLSCLTANALGPAIIAAGGIAYGGYKISWTWLAYDVNIDPYLEWYAEGFYRSSNEFPMALVQGDIVYTAQERCIAEYNRWIGIWETERSSDPYAAEAIKWLIVDRDGLVVLGDTSASIIHPGIRTQMTVEVPPPTTARAGVPVEFSGLLLERETGNPAPSMTVELRRYGVEAPMATAMTDGSGRWRFDIAFEPGIYRIYAKHPGDSYAPSITGIYTVEVSQTIMSDITPPPYRVDVGQPFSFSGVLRDKTTGAGIPSKTINLRQEGVGGPIATTTTGADGGWSFSIAKDTEGFYKFSAEFPGDAEYYVSATSIYTVRVGAKLPSDLSWNPDSPPPSIYRLGDGYLTCSAHLKDADTGEGLGGKSVTLYLDNIGKWAKTTRTTPIENIGKAWWAQIPFSMKTDVAKAGMYKLWAEFLGDDVYWGSRTPDNTIELLKGISTMRVTTPPPASVDPGQEFTFGGFLECGMLGGLKSKKINLYIDGSLATTITTPFGGPWTFKITLTAGTHTVRADFLGDDGFESSSTPEYIVAVGVPPPPEYTLTISSTTGGTTDPAPGSYTYPEGTTVRVTAYPDSGYMFDHWELDGVTRTENPIDVLMDADHTLYAVFVVIPPPEYTLTIFPTTHGTTDPAPGSYRYPAGTVVRVTAIPDSNYILDHWELDGITRAPENPIDVLMDADHTLAAVFRLVPIPPPQYTLTISSTAGGTTDPLPGSYSYPAGTTARVTAYPATGYQFDHWELDGAIRTENPIDVLMDRDHTLHAVFVEAPPPPPPEYTLTISTTVGGTTDPAPGSYVYPEGSIAGVTAIPASGYLFDHWELDGVVRTENPIDVLMDMDHTLHAVFAAAPPPEYTLTISSTAGGTTDPPPGSYRCPAGTSVRVTAIPASGYSFDHWTLDGVASTVNPIDVIMDRDYTLIAYFTPIPPPEYTLTITSTAGGTTDPVPGSYRYPAGSTARVTAIPASGYYFDHWALDGAIRTENPIDVLMDRDRTLTAYFATIPPVEYTLTISSTAGGTTDPAPGSYRYTAGSVARIVAYPDRGYIFDHWEVDGTIWRIENPINLVMDRDHTLHAVFAPAPPVPIPKAALVAMGLGLAGAAVGLAYISRKKEAFPPPR